VSAINVDYALEPALTPGEFLDVRFRSTLSQRRPVDQPEVISQMLRNAGLIFTARVDGHIAGVSRAPTDYAYCT